jgi:hypothetical protein
MQAMRLAVLLMLCALTALPAEDTWAKVRELKSGTELRIYKTNSKDALEAKFERAGDDSLIVTTKSQELSVPKEDIERVDVRRANGGRLKTHADRKVAQKGAEVTQNTIPGGTTTVTTGMSFPSKPGFETVYKRPAPDK